jgi:hypothetical protein
MVSTNLPLDGLVDIRMPIPGNSFEWGPQNIEPLAAKKRLVHHHTAGSRVDEDGFTMAAAHMRDNGWPGVGVNFVITCDEYPGRQYAGGSTPPGAQIQYVGDIASIRAGVLDKNPGSVHVEVVGRFDPGHSPSPSQNQLRLFRKLNEFLAAPNNILPSYNFLNQLTYHNAIAVPGGQTSCPGWQNPKFPEWFAYLQGGAEPSWWQVAPPINPPVPTPEPTPEPAIVPAPETPTSDMTPGKGGASESRPITLEGAFAVNYQTGMKVADIPVGTPIEVGQWVDSLGNETLEQQATYLKTVKAIENGWPNGVPVQFLRPLTGQALRPRPYLHPRNVQPCPEPYRD